MVFVEPTIPDLSSASLNESISPEYFKSRLNEFVDAFKRYNPRPTLASCAERVILLQKTYYAGTYYGNVCMVAAWYNCLKDDTTPLSCVEIIVYNDLFADAILEMSAHVFQDLKYEFDGSEGKHVYTPI